MPVLFLLAPVCISLKNTPVDAILTCPDVQIIIKTAIRVKRRQVVEDQVTYPRRRRCCPVTGRSKRCVVIRSLGILMLCDFWWRHGHVLARRRVLEYLSQVRRPYRATRGRMGPMATGVGWVYLYAWWIKTRCSKTIWGSTTVHCKTGS